MLPTRQLVSFKVTTTPKRSEIKTKVFMVMVVSMMFAGTTRWSRADDDARSIGEVGQQSPKDHLRTASFYLVLEGDKTKSLSTARSGDETRFYAKVWDGLYLQVTSQTGDQGILGYLFSFSKDQADLFPEGIHENQDVPSLRFLSASDFRSSDNDSIRPLKPGLGTSEDRGALRVIPYDGFNVEIRVLEFKIGSADSKNDPYFKSVSCMVRVKEKSPVEKAQAGVINHPGLPLAGY